MKTTIAATACTLAATAVAALFVNLQRPAFLKTADQTQLDSYIANTQQQLDKHPGDYHLIRRLEELQGLKADLKAAAASVF
jgi:hypothetical protein